jgi:hypothetical protein
MRIHIPMRRAFSMIAALLMLTSILPVEAATFGRTTVGTTPSGGLRVDYKRGSKFTLAQPGTLKQLCAYLDGKGTRTGDASFQYFRLVAYKDAGGVPGAKVAEGRLDDSPSAILAGSEADWYCQSTVRAPLSGGDYWLVIHSGGKPPEATISGGTIIRYFYDGTGNWYGNADAFVDGSATSFGAGSTGDGTLSAYAVFDTLSELGAAGRTTVGATPSGALRADFKRGSSFTLTETARITSVSAYLDGLGGGSGVQELHYLIYKDQSGLPGQLVNGSDALLGVTPGMSPRWLTGHVFNQIELAPGKYWLILHTNAPSIARYYYDGAPNWYGNPDIYNDGPSNPFGAGGSGDGTMSAFVSYLRGPFVTQTFGRTDIASQALQPLAANFYRGSRFEAPGENKVLINLYAYLDGQGGASGSQKMMMILPFSGTEGSVIASEEVTVPAGMAPQWVRFPLKTPVHLPANSYDLFLYTGETQGVARSYGDGAANWRGVGAQYPLLPRVGDLPFQEGTVTLSFYAEIRVPAP